MSSLKSHPSFQDLTLYTVHCTALQLISLNMNEMTKSISNNLQIFELPFTLHHFIFILFFFYKKVPENN